MGRAADSGVNGRVDEDDRLRPAAGEDVSACASGRVVVDRIVCPVDFSETSRAALRYAVALAKCHEAEIHALHVVDVALTAGSAELSWDYIRAARAEARVELRGRLQEFLAPAEAVGVLAKADVHEGFAVEQILDYAATARADMIVMGTRGLSGIKRLVLGSTAEKVLRSAPCPVLTVPPHADRTPPSDHAFFSRILCPVNFSEPSLKAVRLALALAQEVNGRLILLHAVDQLGARPGLEYIGLDEQLGSQFLELERNARHRLRQLIPLDAWAWCHPEEAIVVAAETPVRAIVQAARNDQTELIVMSLRPRGGIDRILFGSTTQAVIREATCPVLTVRAA
jgi:nucleotide-binding universal stress UspA family protein